MTDQSAQQPAICWTAHVLRALKVFLRTLMGRMLLSAMLMSVLTMSVGFLTLSSAFRSYVNSDVDAQLETSLNSIVGVSEIGPDGEIRFTAPVFDERFQHPYSGWYWQISEEGHNSVRSRSLWDFELIPQMQGGKTEITFWELDGPDGQTLRVLEQDLSLPGADRIFRFQVATDRAKTEAAIHRFDGLLAWALGLLFASIMALIALQAGFGLRPVRTLRRRLGDIRAGRVDRLHGDWGADLEPAAQEVNALLDQNAQLVQRARTHVGNLAHALKTPLSVLRNELTAEVVDPQILLKYTNIIQRHVEHHLNRARIAGGGSGSGVVIRDRLEKLVHAITRIYQNRDVDVSIDIRTDRAFAGEREDFDELVGNLVDNAMKWAATSIDLSVEDAQVDGRAMIKLVVSDDGPGVEDEQIAELFERGNRLDERVPGTGLGLAIVRDVTELYGGRAEATKSPKGGLQVILFLPAKSQRV